MPEPVKEKLECEESDEVVKRCQKWKEDFETRFPKRKVRLCDGTEGFGSPF